MADLKFIKEKQNRKKYQKEKYIEFIIKYLNEKDFENATLFILKTFFPKHLKKNNWEEMVDNIKNNYFYKYFEFNKKNYYQIVIDIGFILNHNNGLNLVKRNYINKKRKRNDINNKRKRNNVKRAANDLSDFFDIKKDTTYPIIEFKYFKYN